jgi:transcriptional regulator with XRE-family HTH domain
VVEHKKNLDEVLGKRVRELRVAAKEDAEKVAYSAGMTLEAYEASERGERRFRAVELYHIAHRLDVRMQDIASAIIDADIFLEP